MESSGLAWTHLRCTFFAQNFITFPAVQGSYYMPFGDGKIGYIDVRDVAAVAVVVLNGPGHEGKVYELTGPEILGVADVARVISAATGREFKYVDVPAEAARAGMIQHGVPAWYADSLLELYAGAKAGYAARLTDTVEKILGRKPRTFQQFAKDNASRF
ncbi:MAG: NmrA family NAD(P)-binding protein [Nitrospinae bacterium]|nr:NmrA family NAD(P)-binding protein [Nitrospinota bacterium]